MANRILIFYNGTDRQINSVLRLLNKKWPQIRILLIIRKRYLQKNKLISKCHVFARKSPIGWVDALKLLRKLNRMKFDIIGISKQDMTIKILLGIFFLRPERILFFRGDSAQQMAMLQFLKWLWGKRHVLQSALTAVVPLIVLIFQLPLVCLKKKSLSNKKEVLAIVFGNMKQGPLSDSPWLFMWLQVAILHSFIFPKTKSAEVKRVLVIRIDHIGDNVNTIPLVRKLHKDLPGAKISVLCDSGAFIWKNCPYIEEVLIYKTNNKLINKGKKSWRWFFRPFTFYRQIHKRRFDLVIDPVGRTETHIISYLCGTARKISNSYYPYDLYDIEVPIRHYKTNLHETVRALALFKPLSEITNKDTELEFWFDHDIENKIQKIFNAANITTQDRMIGIHVGADSPLRLWPIERFARLAHILNGKYNCKIILFESPNARPITDRFLAELNELNSSAVVIRAASLEELTALISKCRFFICLDSGPMHLAAATNTPIVAIFGPGEFRRWQPQNNHSTIVRKPFDCSPCSQDICDKPECMLDISVDDVLLACEKIMEKTVEAGVCM